MVVLDGRARKHPLTVCLRQPPLPLPGGEEPKPAKGGDLPDWRLLSPGAGGEVDRRNRDGEGVLPPTAQFDFGSLSSMATVNEPSLIAASLAATSAAASAGTLPSKVPSGASEQPPAFMKE